MKLSCFVLALRVGVFAYLVTLIGNRVRMSVVDEPLPVSWFVGMPW